MTNSLISLNNQEIIKLIQGGFNRLETQNLELKAQNQKLYARVEELEKTVIKRLDQIEHCVITIKDKVAFALPLNPENPEEREMQERIQTAADVILKDTDEYVKECEEIVVKTTDRNTKTQFRAIQNQYNINSGKYEKLSHGEKVAEGNWIGSKMTGFNCLIGAPGSKELKNSYPRRAEVLVSILSECYTQFQPTRIRMY